MSLTEKEVGILNLLKKEGMGKRSLNRVAEAMEKYEGAPTLSDSKKMETYLRTKIEKSQLNDEGFWILFLGAKLQPQKVIQIGMGKGDAVNIYLRRIARAVIECNGTRSVVVHNHPSGNLQPSDTDINLTKKLQGFLSNLGAELIDHIILTEFSYYSFADNGRI